MTYAFVPTGLLSLALAGARAAARLAVRVAVALSHRHDVRRLADLTDRELQDIGLVRSDVAGALAEPLHVDPSTVLRLRREEHALRPGPARVRLVPRVRALGSILSPR